MTKETKMTDLPGNLPVRDELERSRLAKIALAAWVGVSPDQLPAEKMWIEHPNHDSRKAWDRAIEALRVEFQEPPK
jgi:hypothetical protein